MYEMKATITEKIPSKRTGKGDTVSRFPSIVTTGRRARKIPMVVACYYWNSSIWNMQD